MNIRICRGSNDPNFTTTSPKTTVLSRTSLGFLLFLLMAVLSGCNTDRLLGTEKKADSVHSLYVVSCCRDNNSGLLSYPSFLPSSHVQLCDRIRLAEDGQINGDTYLAADNDCGKWGNQIGDQYYEGLGY
jgi:hypothetical protein